MITDVLKDAILSNIGALKPAPNKWLKRNCMLCSLHGYTRDIRHRFGIQFNSTSIALHCFNCGFGAAYHEGGVLTKKFKSFLTQINIDDILVKEIDFEIFKQRNNISYIREGDEELTQENKEARFRSLFDKWKPVNLPEDSFPISTWIKAGINDINFTRSVEYMVSRRIYDFDSFYWTPNKNSNLNQRIIIPYYYRRGIVGYTARLTFDYVDKTIPKYLQQLPVNYVYNLDKQQDWARKYVIVNEGVLDAWVTDGISTLGEINQAQIDIINRLQHDIIVCPDRDKNGWGLVKAAIDNDWKVSYPKWSPGIKDAADASKIYGKLLTTHSIIESAVSGKENIEIEWKIAQAERQRRK